MFTWEKQALEQKTNEHNHLCSAKLLWQGFILLSIFKITKELHQTLITYIFRGIDPGGWPDMLPSSLLNGNPIGINIGDWWTPSMNYKKKSHCFSIDDFQMFTQTLITFCAGDLLELPSFLYFLWICVLPFLMDFLLNCKTYKATLLVGLFMELQFQSLQVQYSFFS